MRGGCQAYLRLAMSHRFCLIAPGDWVSTHKVSEAMAMGGAGGCIPIFVLPGKSVAAMQQAAPGMLPYTRWHDFCESVPPAPAHPGRARAAPTWHMGARMPLCIACPRACARPQAFFVRESDARRRMAALLDKFERLSEADVASKRASLRRVRHAFVVRPNASFDTPTAPHYILGDACALAAAYRWRNRTAAEPQGVDHKRPRVSATDVTRCLIEAYEE